MSLAHDRCICLRKIDYSETSQIMLFFGRGHGLVRLIAKGLHRTTRAGASKFGGGIDLLDLGAAVFTDRPEKDLAILCDWKLQDGHPELRRSLRGLYLGFYAAELVSLLIEEHDPHPDLFDGLERTLPELATDRAEGAFLGFELELLRQTGYLPQLEGCASCGLAPGDGEPVYFSAAHGGIICRNCEGSFPDRLRLDAPLLSLAQSLAGADADDGTHPRRVTREQTDPLNRLLADHIQHTLGRRLRLPPYVLSRADQ